MEIGRLEPADFVEDELEMGMVVGSKFEELGKVEAESVLGVLVKKGSFVELLMMWFHVNNGDNMKLLFFY